MVRGYHLGHRITHDGGWRYADTGEPLGGRACVKCGCQPTPDGHDACLGTLPGVIHACCGHGVEKPYAIFRTEA
jgi:hypothetical protein